MNYYINKMETWILVVVFFLGSVSRITGNYDVSVKLLEYNRNKDCSCDPNILYWNCSECDVYFQVCLLPLLPTQRQVCYGNDKNQRVDDTHHFLFANTLRDADCYTWRDIRGQPSFEISVHAFDYDSVGGNDNLGVTKYVYTGNTTEGLNVTTTPGNENLSIKIQLTISCSNNNSALHCEQTENATRTTLSTSITSATLENAKINTQSKSTSGPPLNIPTANTPRTALNKPTANTLPEIATNISRTPTNSPSTTKISSSITITPRTTPTTATTTSSTTTTTQTTDLPTITEKRTTALPSTTTRPKTSTFIKKWLSVVVGVSAAVLFVIIGAVTCLYFTKTRIRRIDPGI